MGIVLDIDETLSWTVGYWISKMVKKFDNPEELSPEELVRKYRYVQNIPYWQTNEINFWIEQQINSDEFQIHLPLIEANVIYHLSLINKIAPITGYLTTRPEKVRKGTLNWLSKHNFPKLPVHFRPSSVPHSHSHVWKADYLINSYPTIQGIIDDDSRIIPLLADNYGGHIFLFGHTKYDGEGQTLNIHCVRNWTETSKIVMEVFGAIQPLKSLKNQP